MSGLPRRTDLRSICLIGSGPIVIGQACEFDYAGCQALKVLREDGFRTIVVNSNPATIMTDPGFADATYLEPLDLEGVADVLGRERPDALLPTLGGQTALNLADRARGGGRARRARRRAARRPGRRDPPRRGPAALPRGRAELRPRRCRAPASSPRLDDLAGVALACGRSAGVHAGRPRRRVRCYRRASSARQVEIGLRESPIGQVLVEESVKGWDEFELEVIRDRRDNVVIVCSIENLDPMGVHTGDSVTVAPQLTLSDEAYQELRDAAIAVIRAVGVETGGSNIQFARERETRRAARDRDEPARLPLVRARLEGDRLPDRQGRRQARRRLHARRDPERPDEDDAGELRADARLRRRQVPALRLREVPRRRHRARHADEVGRRGDGDRAHLPGGVREGVREPRARRRLGDALGDARRPARRAASLVPARAGAAARRGAAAGPARVPARRLLRRRGRGRLELLLLDPRRGGRGAARAAASRASSSSARARTGSARGSSSTTAASTPRRASARSATRR